MKQEHLNLTENTESSFEPFFWEQQTLDLSSHLASNFKQIPTEKQKLN